MKNIILSKIIRVPDGDYCNPRDEKKCKYAKPEHWTHRCFIFDVELEEENDMIKKYIECLNCQVKEEEM